MSTIRLIYRNVPKWMKLVISSGVTLQLIGHIVLKFATNEAITLSTKNTLYLIVGTIAFGIIGLFIGAWRVASSSQTQSGIQNDNLRELPTSHVTIGNISNSVLSVGIRAKIVLLEN